MGNEPVWKVERQPAWLVVAIKKTITELPGGYAEAAEWLGVTENALFNRLRVDGDQILPALLQSQGRETGKKRDQGTGVGRHSLGAGEASPRHDAGERRRV